jgi:hypothetical protein
MGCLLIAFSPQAALKVGLDDRQPCTAALKVGLYRPQRAASHQARRQAIRLLSRFA